MDGKARSARTTGRSSLSRFGGAFSKAEARTAEKCCQDRIEALHRSGRDSRLQGQWAGLANSDERGTPIRPETENGITARGASRKERKRYAESSKNGKRNLPKHWSECRNEEEEARWWDANSSRIFTEAVRKGTVHWEAPLRSCDRSLVERVSGVRWTRA